MSKLLLDGLPTDEDVYVCRPSFSPGHDMVRVGRVEGIRGQDVHVRFGPNDLRSCRRDRVWRRRYEAEAQAIGIIEVHVARIQGNYERVLDEAGKALDVLKSEPA
jgi:hypothetical protein